MIETIKPYYENALTRLYLADNRLLLHLLDEFALLCTDPPYAIGADKRQAQRANKQHGAAVAPSRDYGFSDWDKQIDDAHLLAIRAKAKKQIIFGGNYFRLPPSSCWLVWDKYNGANDYADAELAWTNLKKPVRHFRYRYQGMIQQVKETRYHPTQKPFALMVWCIKQAGQVKSVFDPFAGVGTTLKAAQSLGIQSTGIEATESYCEIAAKRLDGKLQ